MEPEVPRRLRILRDRQDRAAWRTELSAVLARARQEGDSRPGNQILHDWLRFRRRYIDEDHDDD